MQAPTVRRRRSARRLVVTASVLAAAVAVSPLTPLTDPASAQPAAGGAPPSVIHTFDEAAVGSVPAGWTQFGSGAGVQDLPAGRDTERNEDFPPTRFVRLSDTSTTETLAIGTTFDMGPDKPTVEARVRIRAEQATSTVGVHLDTTPGQHAVTLGMSDRGRLYTYDGATVVDLGPYVEKQWYDVRILAETGRGTARIFVDGKELARDNAFRLPVEAFTALQVLVGSPPGTGVALVDEVRVDAHARPAGFTQTGSIRPRTTAPGRSPFIGGCETMDRDFTKYASYKKYLPHLGVDRCRIQAGWNEIENNSNSMVVGTTDGAGNFTVTGTKPQGVFDPEARFDASRARYDFTELDAEVDGLVAQGIRPLLGIVYGNWYIDGLEGSPQLGGKLPMLSRPESIKAHSNFVLKLAERYAGKVDWELWNEVNKTDTAQDYSRFIQRVGPIIRSKDADAQLWFGTYGVDEPFVRNVLTDLRTAGKLDLVDVVAYHPYDDFPDNPKIYRDWASAAEMLKGFSPEIRLVQGENGNPSQEGSSGYAPPGTPTQRSQWVGNTRRYLGDWGVGIEGVMFGVADMNYRWSRGDVITPNYKGFIDTNLNSDVILAKQAFYAAQNLTSVFDRSLKPITSLRAAPASESPITGYPYTASGDRAVTLRAFEKDGTGQQAVAVWFGGDEAKPADEKAPILDATTTPVTLTFENCKMDEPRLAQIGSGGIFEFPNGSVTRSGNRCTFTGVPLSAAPILIADRSVLAG